MDPLSITGLLTTAYLALRRMISPATSALVPIPVAPPSPTAARTIAFSYPLFTPMRGAHRTTQERANAFLAAVPGPMFNLAGICFPAREHLNKLIFVTGKPGAGKTTICRMMLASLAGLFPILPAQSRAGMYPGEGKMRWCVIDPTNAFLPLLYRVVPPDVPIVRLSPHDADGAEWDIAKDVTNEIMNEALQRGLFPESLAKNSDPFWTTKGREVTQAVVSVFLHRQSNWSLRDLVVPIKYPQFLKPLLRQCPRTRGMTKHELVGRLGRDIVATCSGTINRVATAAALWAKAKRKYSLRDFLNERAVAHFAFTPVMAASLAGVANAMTYILILLTLDKNEEFNHTLLFGDESRYLSEITGIEDLAARGRGAGLGAVLLAQGTPGLISTWGEKRVAELLDLVNSWICLRSGADTAELFSKHVGVVEGLQKSYSFGTTSSRSVTDSSSVGGSSSWSGGSSSNWGASHSVTSSTSTTYTESFALHTKAAILPSEVTNLPLANPHSDRIEGFAFVPDVGAFEFTSNFIDTFKAYAPAPFSQMPVRPDSDQILEPWTLKDLQRLNLESTTDFHQALRSTWGSTGGIA